MKRLTISIDENIARWARSDALRQGTSVSRLICRLLEERMRHDEGYQAAMDQYFARHAVNLGNAKEYPSRDEPYD